MLRVGSGAGGMKPATGTGGTDRATAAAFTAEDVELLDRLQWETFEYFLREVEPSNGLIADKTRADWPASIAATGLALASYPIGVERGYLSREEAAARTLTTLRFFHDSPQGPEPDATGYKGFYYHFLDMRTGRRAWRCELSTVDTAFLLAGALTAGLYFEGDTVEESAIRDLAEALYGRADWHWALNGGATVSHGWKPERGFLRWRWEGYDEALLLYVLALGSPTSPIPKECYAAWLSTYSWKTIYGRELIYAGPLFIHQLSHLWIDFRGLHDDFLRGKGRSLDYFENSRRATHVQREYAIRNPREFVGYGEACWGITASDGPGPLTLRIEGVQRKCHDYVARGVPFGPDDGTLAPWAVVASLPFAPEVVLPTVRHFAENLHLERAETYGFKATFNPTFPAGGESAHGWVSPWNFGLNQGPIVMSIENVRTGLLWRLMQKSPHVLRGLRRAGFEGGWLE
ncbi:MAG: glucoamylase family protein [Gemmatimonadota bacterium]